VTGLKRVVVIGGTGHFGGRICRRLVREPGIELVVTSRHVAAGNELARSLSAQHSQSNVVSAALDQFSATFEEDLSALNPAIVLHTAGPYQGQNYRVAEACIKCGSHYIDLADGKEFVTGFSALNEAAKDEGVMLVSGASTLPGLSSAVIEALRNRFGEIKHIEISIAPAHQTPRGAGTIASVLSYCGTPFSILVDGKQQTVFGWQSLKMQRYPSLGRRLSAVCDVPDLALLKKLVPGVETVTFHAALEASWEQLALWMMAWLTRLNIVTDWTGFVPIFQKVSDGLIGLGSASGGMHIRLSGSGSDGKPAECTWYLTAHQNHGPEIPCIPALVLARKLIRNRLTLRGAYACLGLMSLAEFDEEAADLDISWVVV